MVYVCLTFFANATFIVKFKCRNQYFLYEDLIKLLPSTKLMGTKDSVEFKHGLRDLAQFTHQLNSPFDRVRCVEWVRKLASLSDDDLETSKTKNEYIQLLRIQVRNNFLHGPFVNPPPEESLCPLPECLGNLMAKQIPYLPRVGPISPVLYHKSPDGRAYISAKQIPGGGVFCYMAVSPDGLK